MTAWNSGLRSERALHRRHPSKKRSLPLRRLAVGWGIGTLGSILGVSASYFLDLPTGAAVVCVFGLVLLAVGLLKVVLRTV